MMEERVRESQRIGSSNIEMKEFVRDFGRWCAHIESRRDREQLYEPIRGGREKGQG